MESASSTQGPLCVLNAGFLSDLPFSGISLNTCTFVASATIVVISPTTVTATSSTTWSKVSWWNVRLAKNTFHSLPWLRTSWTIAHSGRHCQRLPQACLPCLTSGSARGYWTAHTATEPSCLTVTVAEHLRWCAGSHIFCRDCDTRHQKACISRCGLMDDIIIQMKFKSNCCDSGRKYTPYCEFAGHLCTTRAVEQQLKSVRAWKECILDTSALVCSECRLPLRPPIFRHLLGNMPVCSACYHRGDIANYCHCHELDYLVDGILVECEACKEYLPFPTLASHQLENCSFKQTLLKIGPGSRARKNVCDEEKTESPSVGSNSIHGKNERMPPLEVGKMDKHIVHSDESGNDDDSCDDNHGTCEHVFSCEDYSIDKMDEGKEVENPETVKRVTENAFKTPCEKAEIAMPNGQKTDEEKIERLSTCCSCIHGKNKQKAPYGVGKMDKYIVHGDEVGNDDSSDDNHAESGMRVAENAFKTSACNMKVKIATPYGQKTAPTAAQAGTSRCRHLPITAPSKPPLPRCPGTRLFQAAHNRNRGDKMAALATDSSTYKAGQQRTKREDPNIQQEKKRRSCEQS
ncbi:hypothetical protein PAHAL_4G075900 [Panicum hallii]|uniref:Uncharacterized protein n=1 Tax=Panicum hallii TaxID=206008 RepID=A0A2T8JC64_9POAL|nr:hypothetical protein PAHAL_4G075900 [Panicum hallii]